MTAVRVAFDTGPLHGHRTGIGRAVAALHDALVERDDIELRPYLLSFRARPADGVTRLPLPAAVAHRLWQHGRRPHADRWLVGADVVHGTNYVVPPTRLARLVSVYDCWFLRHPDQASLALRRAGDLLRRSVAEGAVVHTSSGATADELRALLPGVDARVVHLGPLDLPAPPPVSPFPTLIDVPFVVAIGTVERRKNLPTLIGAFAILAAHHADVRLVLAGAPGDDTVAVNAAIDALPDGARRRVMTMDHLDEAGRSWLLHHASALAYPSLDEGFGFPLLDAMQAGVPVVGSRRGSIPEIAGEAALLVDAGRADQLAEALDTVLTDTATAAALVAAGRLRLDAFSWQRCAAGITDLYHELAERGGHR